MPFIFDDLCVVVGVVIAWIINGGRYSLEEELKAIKFGDFFGRRWREGIVGLFTIVLIIVLIWAVRHFA